MGWVRPLTHPNAHAHVNIDNTVNTTAINGEMSIDNQCPQPLPAPPRLRSRLCACARISVMSACVFNLQSVVEKGREGKG